jgi:hypothetical protein
MSDTPQPEEVNEEAEEATAATPAVDESEEVSEDAEEALSEDAAEVLDSEPEMTPVEEAPKVEKKAKAKPAKKATAAQSTAQAVDALVTTITSMAESVSTLSSTVDALSAKVATPPAPIVVEHKEEEPVVETPVEEEPKNDSIPAVALASFGSLASFVGVGLVAAAAMRDNFDTNSLIMAVVGVALFAVNGLVVDRDRSVTGLQGHAIQTAMTLLAVIGVGLLVGGIQRFSDDPHRAAFLLPLGTALFVVATAWKMRDRLANEHLVWMAGVGVWVCLFLGVGLNQVANNIDPHEKVDTQDHIVTGGPVGHETTPTTAAGHGDEHGASSDAHGASTEAHGPTTTVAHGDDHGAAAATTDGHGTDASHAAPSTTTTTAHVTEAHDSGTHAADPSQSAINEAVRAGNKAAAEHH